MIKRVSALLVAAMIALAAGCSGEKQTPSPTSTTETSATPLPTAPSTSPSSLPSRSNTPIASAEIGRGKVTARPGQVTDRAVRYFVHAACQGTESMTYKVVVAGVMVSQSTFPCGIDSLSSAFEGKLGRVQIELVDDDQDGEGEGFAEVIAQP